MLILTYSAATAAGEHAFSHPEPRDHRDSLLQKELAETRAQTDRLRRQTLRLQRTVERDPGDPASARLYHAYTHDLAKKQRALDSLRHQSYVDEVLKGAPR